MIHISSPNFSLGALCHYTYMVEKKELGLVQQSGLNIAYLDYTGPLIKIHMVVHKSSHKKNLSTTDIEELKAVTNCSCIAICTKSGKKMKMFNHVDFKSSRLLKKCGTFEEDELIFCYKDSLDVFIFWLMFKVIIMLLWDFSLCTFFL